MFYEIAINNTVVITIYILAGLIVLKVTGSKLAPYAPWAVFTMHMVRSIFIFLAATSYLGWLTSLALVIPHGWVEITGLTLACSSGSRICYGQRPWFRIALAGVLIIIGAYIETYITPFPLQSWVSF